LSELKEGLSESVKYGISMTSEKDEFNEIGDISEATSFVKEY
jgi:hypothetical protein